MLPASFTSGTALQIINIRREQNTNWTYSFNWNGKSFWRLIFFYIILADVSWSRPVSDFCGRYTISCFLLWDRELRLIYFIHRLGAIWHRGGTWGLHAEGKKCSHFGEKKEGALKCVQQSRSKQSYMGKRLMPHKFHEWCRLRGSKCKRERNEGVGTDWSGRLKC